MLLTRSRSAIIELFSSPNVLPRNSRSSIGANFAFAERSEWLWLTQPAHSALQIDPCILACRSSRYWLSSDMVLSVHIIEPRARAKRRPWAWSMLCDPPPDVRLPHLHSVLPSRSECLFLNDLLPGLRFPLQCRRS